MKPQVILLHNVVSNHHNKSVKLTLGALFLAPPFLLPDEAKALLSSLGFEPVGDQVTFTDFVGVGEATEPDNQGYSSSDSISAASTNLDDASSY
mmetsp:Transcript_40193/g.71800  ORF Transcript_40193/g.71800 Transcript_40193/m.71800 type:complete len:94 (+) Transcript_40193:506-787(+)